MADEKKTDQKEAEKKDEGAHTRITPEQRMRYIGFDVFPGKPKDLFKNKEEEKSLVERILKQRDEGKVLRDECTLLEQRVTMRDRLVMTIACVVVLAALFLPWYSVHNEIVEDAPVPSTTVPDPLAEAMMTDTLADTLAGASDTAMAVIPETAGEEPEDTAAIAQAALEDDETAARTTIAGEREGEELITAYAAKKKIHKEYEVATGVGAVTLLGSISSYVFGSGFVLIITGILLLLYTLLSVALPAYTLYGLYGTKGDADERALALKKILRFNWIPLVLLVIALILSFIGASYGFNSQEYFTSLGDNYNVGVFLGSLTWGLLISLSAFVLLAAKGVEI